MALWSPLCRKYPWLAAFSPGCPERQGCRRDLETARCSALFAAVTGGKGVSAQPEGFLRPERGRALAWEWGTSELLFGVGAGLPASAAPRGAVHAAPSPGPCGLSGESRRGGAGGSASQVCRESRVINCCLPLPPSALVVTAVFDRDVNCRRAASVSLPALLFSRGGGRLGPGTHSPRGSGVGSVRGATAQEWAAPPWGPPIQRSEADF